MSAVQQAKAVILANPGVTKVAEIAAIAGIDISDMKAKAAFSVAVGRAKKQIEAGDTSTGEEVTEATAAPVKSAPAKAAPKPAKAAPVAPAPKPATAAPATTTAAPATTAAVAAKKTPVPPKKVAYSDDLLEKTVVFLSHFKTFDEALLHVNRVRKLQISRG